MPVRSDEPLRKVTLNLYESDCKWLEKEYGHGWTERVRQHIHGEVQKREQAINNPYISADPKVRRMKLGDLADEYLRYNKER